MSSQKLRSRARLAELRLAQLQYPGEKGAELGVLSDGLRASALRYPQGGEAVELRRFLVAKRWLRLVGLWKNTCFTTITTLRAEPLNNNNTNNNNKDSAVTTTLRKSITLR